MKINEILAEYDMRTKSKMASFLQGMGANDAASAVDAYHQSKYQGGKLGKDRSPKPKKPIAKPQPVPEQPDYNKAIFQDPAVFKSAWDQYVSMHGGANYRLISDPRMLDVLKHIWKRIGNDTLESLDISEGQENPWDPSKLYTDFEKYMADGGSITPLWKNELRTILKTAVNRVD
jgi:hypothetical protein